MNYDPSTFNARHSLDVNAAAMPFLEGIDALMGPDSSYFALVPILHFDSPMGESLVLGETLTASPIRDDFENSEAAGDLVGPSPTLLPTATGDALTGSGTETADTVAAAVAKARASLQNWRDSNNFASGVRSLYGHDVDVAQAAAWLDSLLASSGAPHNLQVVNSLGSAEGAYAAANDTIYLSESFVANPNRSVDDLARVIIEELGHALDARLNETDTAGDEGALFAAAVTGEKLSAAERAAITTEDDSATVVIEGQALAIEQSASEADVLLLRSASLTWGDELIIDRLSAKGFNVTHQSLSSFQQSDAYGAELVAVTNSYFSSNNADVLDDLAVPIISFQVQSLDELDIRPVGMSYIARGTTVTITDSAHPLSAGFSGEVQIYTYGNGGGYIPLLHPTGDALEIATFTGGNYGSQDNDSSPILAYEKGANLLNGKVALERRVAFLPYHQSFGQLTDEGWQLFDAAIDWAIEGSSGVGASPAITLALSNDTGTSDSDGLTADPTVSGQLSEADTITSLQARIGSGQSVDIADTLLPDGSFSLDLERLSDLNGGSLAYGDYTVEILAQTAGGGVGSTTVDFRYEFQQAPLPYSNGEWVPLALEAGATTFQFGLPGGIANDDQLLVYLLNENDPTDTLLSNGAAGNPLLSGTGRYLAYDPGLVSIADQTVTVDVSSLTPAEIDAAAVYFLVFSEIESAPAAAPVYYAYSGGGGFGGGGFGGFGSLSRFDYTNTSAGGATAGSGGDSTPGDPGSGGGGGGSDPTPAPAEKQFLTRLGDGDYVVAYGLLDEDDSFTKPTAIKFGSNVLTLNYSDTGVFEGSSNDELLDVVLAAVGLTSLDSLAAGEIAANATKSLLPSAQTLQLQDVWSRIGEIALKPNKDFDQLTQDKQLKLLNFQENLLKATALTDDFTGHKEDKELLKAIVEMGNVYAEIDPNSDGLSDSTKSNETFLHGIWEKSKQGDILKQDNDSVFQEDIAAFNNYFKNFTQAGGREKAIDFSESILSLFSEEIKTDQKFQNSLVTDGLLDWAKAYAYSQFYDNPDLLVNNYAGIFDILWNEQSVEFEEDVFPLGDILELIRTDSFVDAVRASTLVEARDPVRDKRGIVGGRTFEEAAAEHIPHIFRGATTRGVLDKAQLAYMLATAEWESLYGHFDDRFLDEEIDEAQANSQYAFENGNGDAASGDGFRFRGRGYAHITARYNYRKFVFYSEPNSLEVQGLVRLAALLPEEDIASLSPSNLELSPDVAAIPTVAADIMAIGMHRGIFRPGNKLSDYIDSTQGRDDFDNFFDARAIINSDKNNERKVSQDYREEYGNDATVGKVIAINAESYLDALRLIELD